MEYLTSLLDSWAIQSGSGYALFVRSTYAGAGGYRISYTDASMTNIIAGSPIFNNVELVPEGKTLSSFNYYPQGSSVLVYEMEIRKIGDYPSWWQ